MWFDNAIVRRPCRAMIEGITSAQLGKPDYERSLVQHDSYVAALEKCGVEVTIMEADEQYPDSVFVEDTAIVTERCAVITRPGASSRQGEETSVKQALAGFYATIEVIEAPATLDGGDVMRTDNHFYIGLSKRTNISGAEKLSHIFNKYGYTSSLVKLDKFLHLKTGVAYLENNLVLVAGEFVDHPSFAKFSRIVVPEFEAYAANSIWVNDRVLMPEGFEQTQMAVEGAGYPILPVPVDEFRKLDGGLSCLSLRF